MAEKKLFLTWLLFASLISVGIIIGIQFDVFSFVYTNDASKLSIAIFAVFIIMTLYCGNLAWRLSCLKEKVEHAEFNPAYYQTYKKIEIGILHVEEAINNSVLAGFLGTVLGVMLMIYAIKTMGTVQIASLADVWEIAKWAFTASITTAVGIISAILLSIQRHLLRIALWEKKNGQG